MNVPIPKSVGVTEFRRNMPVYLQRAEGEAVLLSSRGNKQYVIVSLSMFNNRIMDSEEYQNKLRAKKKDEFLQRLREYGPFSINTKQLKFRSADFRSLK